MTRRRIAGPGASLVLMALACAAAARAAWALDPARYLPPPGAPYGAEEVRVRTAGPYSLGGTLTVPRDGRRRHPAVVLVSGAGSQDRDDADGTNGYRPFAQLADTLSRRGIAVLRLDDRGIGSSTGSIDSMTTAERALDTRAALDFLRARPDVLPAKLGLVGRDEGGTIASMIAAEVPDLAGLVVMGAPQQAAAAPLVHVPLLILHGARDASASPAQVDALAQRFREGGDRDVTLRVFPGLDRTFLEPANPTAGSPAPMRLPAQVLGTIADWVARRLAPGPEAKEPPRRVVPHRRRVVRHRRR